MKKSFLSIFIALLILSLAAGAFAMPILEGTGGGSFWTANEIDSDGVHRAAQAILSMTSPTSFAIDLLNVAPYTHVPNQVLVGLFFDYNGGAVTNPHVSAIGPIIPGPLPHGNNLDGEWSFRNDVNGINGGRGQYGILASSFDPLEFSTPIEPTMAYLPPPAPAGADFGIVSGDLTGLVPSQYSYVLSHVRIDFDIMDASFDPYNISQVHFAYGTSYEDDVPEPGTLMILGSGLLGVAALRRKRFKK